MQVKPDTTTQEMLSDLAALKSASRARERLPRHTPAWELAVSIEDRALARVRRWSRGG
jgi:hypothetical protein